MQYTPRTKSDAMIVPPVAKPISLPQMPFEIPAATHDETAPRVQMTRGNLTPEMKRWLRSVARAARTNTAKTPSRREATIMGEVGL